MAALRVFVIDGGTDREFLERVFQKLLVNFTWWVNREDADGNNVFSGGFLGLDNISPIDRSNLPEGVALEQADGTAWMAYYALTMLLIALALAEENDVYLDMVIKFLEQFVLIARALEPAGPLRRRGRVLLRPARLPVGRDDAGEGADDLGPDPGASRRGPAAEGRRRAPPSWASASRACGRAGRRPAGAWSAACAELGRRAERAPLGDPTRSICGSTLEEFFDEAAFLSPHGLRAVSKRYENNPYTLPGVDGAWIDYQPAESTTTMFGGNSNWRGPIWMPVNYLADPPVRPLPALLRRRLQARVPDGLGAGAHVRRDRAGPRRPARRDLAAGRPTAAARSTATPRSSRRTRPGRTTSPSTSTSTATTAPASARRTRPGWTALVADLILDPPGHVALSRRPPRRSFHRGCGREGSNPLSRLTVVEVPVVPVPGKRRNVCASFCSSPCRSFVARIAVRRSRRRRSRSDAGQDRRLPQGRLEDEAVPAGDRRRLDAAQDVHRGRRRHHPGAEDVPRSRADRRRHGGIGITVNLLGVSEQPDLGDADGKGTAPDPAAPGRGPGLLLAQRLGHRRCRPARTSTRATSTRPGPVYVALGDAELVRVRERVRAARRASS